MEAGTEQEERRRIQRAWFRALDHARSTGIKPFWRVGDYYTIDSPTGHRYTVRPLQHNGRVHDYWCDCPAYVAGHVCWHRALVAALPGEIRRRKQVEHENF